MRIRDFCFTEVPTFQTRLLYAQFTNSYDCDAEAKFGYLDGAKECLEGNKSTEELEALIEASNDSDEYTKAFRQAIKDYLKEREED